MDCPVCAHENPESAKFCNQCGGRLGRGARDSGSLLHYTPRHLAERVLRSRAALEGERKQVTVLFADLKGSLDLARRLDPEEWHRVLDGFFGILTDGVHRFEGTVNQYTGDGIMALFGAPLAHEDHAQRACHAALHVSRALARYGEEFRRRHGLEFPVRMGMNSGEVVVGKIGDDLRMDYTAQGHVVGLAARMEQIAEPGSVYVTERVAELVHGFFSLREIGRREVPGAGAPILVFALAGEGPARTRLDIGRERGLSRFVGRNDAMQTLDKAFERAREGSGLTVGVEGEAGVGKSRLCLEFIDACRGKGFRVHEAHCPPHGRVLPLLVVRDLLHSILGTGDGTQSQTRDALRSGAATDEDGLALLADFLGAPDPERPAPPVPPRERERRVARLARAIVVANARAEPTVLLVDDLHWMDPASGAFLADLVAGIADTRALLLLNFRPEFRAPSDTDRAPAPDWLEHPNVYQLGLRPLTREASRDLLATLIGDESAHLAEALYERSGGNPFFLEEVVRSLADSGQLAGSPGAYAWVGGSELEVPPSVKQVIAARIDRLPTGEKDLLQIASVIGRKFQRKLLARLTPLSEAELAASLHHLEAAAFLHRESLSRPDDLCFNHSLTREVAYGSLLHERRTALHADLARAFEDLGEKLGERAALIAHHWEMADDPGEARRWRNRAAFRVTNLVPKRRWPHPASE